MTYSCSRHYYRLSDASTGYVPPRHHVYAALAPLALQVAFAAGVALALVTKLA